MKTNPYSIRLTKYELKAIDARAKEWGMTRVGVIKLGIKIVLENNVVNTRIAEEVRKK